MINLKKILIKKNFQKIQKFSKFKIWILRFEIWSLKRKKNLIKSKKYKKKLLFLLVIDRVQSSEVIIPLLGLLTE